MRRLLALATLLLAAAPAPTPTRPTERVRLDTSLGAIVIEVALKHAPITAANFLAYVDQHKFDGVTFYRAARNKYESNKGFVQGGVNHIPSRSLFPIDHEPTSKTGLHHLSGTISMARLAPGSATGDWSIMVGPNPYMDAHGKDPGYAAFGHVVSGMPVVRQILAGKTYPNAAVAAMKGQMLVKPVQIVSARRVP